MALSHGVGGGDDGAAGLFEEEDDDFTDEEDSYSETLLRLRSLASAAESGDLNALRLALDNFDGNIDDPMEDGDTLLHITCLYGHLTCVQFLLERGASLEERDEDGGIPLHDACAGGYTEVAQLLLNAANNPERAKRMVETIDVEGDTPLHHAARGKYVDAIKLLLAYGASPNTPNLYGRTPVELADPGTEARSVLEESTGAGAVRGH